MKNVSTFHLVLKYQNLMCIVIIFPKVCRSMYLLFQWLYWRSEKCVVRTTFYRSIDLSQCTYYIPITFNLSFIMRYTKYHCPPIAFIRKNIRKITILFQSIPSNTNVVILLFHIYFKAHCLLQTFYNHDLWLYQM